MSGSTPLQGRAFRAASIDGNLPPALVGAGKLAENRVHVGGGDTQLMGFAFILLKALCLDSVYLLTGVVCCVLQSLARAWLPGSSLLGQTGQEHFLYH